MRVERQRNGHRRKGQIMQPMIEPMPSNPETQVDVKKVSIQCAGGVRNVIFLPSQNLLFIHEHGSQRKIELGYSSSRILEILIDRADAIVSRDDIFVFAWPDRIVGQNSLNQAISTIRELLADDELREIIQTVPRRGYQFNSKYLVSPEQLVEVSAAIQASPETVVTVVPAPHQSTWSKVPWGPAKGLMAIVVLLLAGLLLRIDWSLWLQPGLVKQIEAEGLLTVWYIGARTEDVEKLQANTRAVRERMLTLLEAPGTVIFNTMHSFYEIVCISGSTVEFVTVHKSKLSTLTDEQLDRCLK
jgi:cholera toxin transcriptional activator